ncbi:hypothetical protein CFC21_093750 [Triticum aestivum]|uniref:Uncharacterized protein n=2 Tax=Triticum aestivum TaxID=4565 RepID=A0A9R1LLL5_WHEAT|nr:hypothetical protein CFC21_093750 [Triticum aestivum]
MEIATPPPEFPFDGAVLGDDAYPAGSVSTRNPFGSADALEDGNPFLATTAVTAPPSPNPFGLLPPDVSADGLSDGADPFDLFQHFASAPASPERAAAIYAQFSGAGDDGDSFQPRASYSSRRTVESAVPFDWEEKPGTPKPGVGSGAAATATGEGENADFDFGVLLDRSAQEPDQLTTADELFVEGKIRPLKPPPRLLDGGSVGSSPRSARSAMWSPRLRGLAGPGPDFDPFATAMANASKAAAPSPLGPGVKDAAPDTAADTVPMNPDSVASPRSVPPTANNGGRKKWRLSDLLLFRRLSAKGRAGGSTITREPVFKYSPVQHLGAPVKKTEPVGATANGDASAGGKQKKQSKYGATAGAEDGAARPGLSLMGCVRLNPGLHRLAKGLNGSSTSHFGRRTARAAMHSG